MIEFVIWQIRLWLTGARWRSCSRHFSEAMRWHNTIAHAGRLERIADRLSPWTKTGYRRTWLRKLLYRVRFARRFLVMTAWAGWCRLLTRFAPYVGPGRFEGIYDPRNAIKAEWLYDHSEYAAETTGDIGDGDPQHSMIFSDLDVPWSRYPETWILGIGPSGFVSASQYDDDGQAWYEFRDEDLAIQRSHTEDDEPFESYFDREQWDRIIATERDPSEVYGTPEHEAWLVEMERREG